MAVKIASATARKEFANILGRVVKDNERVKLTRYGKTQAIVIPKKDLELLEKCEEQNGGGAGSAAASSKAEGKSAGKADDAPDHDEETEQDAPAKSKRRPG